MIADSTNPPGDLPPRHVRAARALLAWSQQDLAKRAGVATSTVADFERGRRTPVANNAKAIRSALESAGIRFLPTGAVVGPPIPRLPGSERPGLPVRWVDAEDLADWADRLDGVASVPTLLAYLIRATHGSSVRLRFPSDEGIRHSGWDGHTIADRASGYLPRGEAGWEIGSQRRGVAQKATEDYRKRTAEPAPLDPATSAYIFVTPRHWSGKDAWAEARQVEGPWREVRVYDADDLVHWIEQAPAVGAWLATRLGKRPPGARALEEVWEEWSLATEWPLTEDLILSDRDEDTAEVLRWLRGEPSILSIQATTTDEAVAFFHATLGLLPDEVAAHYRSRCLVATDAATARALAKAPARLILVLTEPDPGLARRLAEAGHHVLQTYDDRPISNGDVRQLARPSRKGIANALVGAGIPEPRAEALARDSARNLAILRRLIPSAPGGLPVWAQQRPPRALLGALLVGAWDEGLEADRASISELAGEPYEQVIGALAPYVGAFDSPLRRIGSTWHIASPRDAWLLLARYLSTADVERFEAVAEAVLGSADPRFEMDPHDRWMASVRGIVPAYSELHRHGVGEVLILLAMWGDRIGTSSGGHRRADAIVRKLLRNADERRWWSLSRDFRLLAEASPAAFLTAVEDSLDRNDPPIRVLFDSDEAGVFGAEYLSDLLWALESLAWSPGLLPRVTLLLARLDAFDDRSGRAMNRPANSLRQIHLLWLPQTHATLDQRLSALDLVRKHESDAAWKLMLGLMPKGLDASIPSAAPRWRDFSVDEVEEVTWPLVRRGAAAISLRLLDDVGLDASRWLALLDHLPDMPPDREALLSALESAEPQIGDNADRAGLWAGLRRLLHRHREIPDAEWSIPAEELGRIEAVYDRLAPTDRLDRVAWLFDHSVNLPDPSHDGWEAERRQIDDAQRKAALAVFSERGVAGILDLARRVSGPGYIGKSLFEAGLQEADLDSLLEATLRSEDERERDVAHGLIMSAFRDRKETWAAALIARVRDEGWGDTALLTVLRALPQERWTWNQVRSAGEAIETDYWRGTPVFWMDEGGSDVAFAVRKLISVGRARHAVTLAGRGRNVRLPSELLVKVLREALRQPFADRDASDLTMFQHYITEILKQLDGSSDITTDTLARLELAYLPILERSRRPATALSKALSEQPSLFIEMLKESDLKRPGRAGHPARRLLDKWNRLPGVREDGTINAAVLESWIEEARSLAGKAGLEDKADTRIGIMLSAAPPGVDGVWPAEAVRSAIDLFGSSSMIRGFWIGKRNRRGVTTRTLGEGGQQERDEAARFREWAVALAYEHPYTAKALDDLADSYEDEARRHDEDAERLDWES